MRGKDRPQDGQTIPVNIMYPIDPSKDRRVEWTIGSQVPREDVSRYRDEETKQLYAVMSPTRDNKGCFVWGPQVVPKRFWEETRQERSEAHRQDQATAVTDFSATSTAPRSLLALPADIPGHRWRVLRELKPARPPARGGDS
jgi:hypothetical protein